MIERYKKYTKNDNAPGGFMEKGESKNFGKASKAYEKKEHMAKKMKHGPIYRNINKQDKDMVAKHKINAEYISG